MTPVAVSKDGAPDDGGVGERDDVALDVERIAGGLASDTLRGGPGTDVLEGGPGDDTLDALGGDDTLLGDAGAGAGSDKLSGGPEPTSSRARAATTAWPATRGTTSWKAPPAWTR